MFDRLTPTHVFDTYWRFANERQNVYLRKLSNPNGPWTDDPILQTYRFTNPYRATDRVSQYLIGSVQYDIKRSQSPQEVFFRTILFKIFNKIETWEALEKSLGNISWQSADQSAILNVLNQLKAKQSIYSAAYIMSSPPFGHKFKHENHIAMLWQMMNDGLPGKIAQSQNIEEIYNMILAYPGMGKFLAFQYTIDINYSSITDHGESGYVVAGPGAIDGISKCFIDTGGLSAQDVIYAVTDNQSREFDRLGIDFPGLFGRPLQPIDCQNLFCEISKYSRVAHPEVAGIAGRTRIKQKYTASPDKFPNVFFPPKWEIDTPNFTMEKPSASQFSLL